MEFDNSFEVPLPPAEAWPVLIDIRRIAPCMPGATLESVDGDNMTGNVKVKLGPVTMNFAGDGKFVSKDEANHTAVIDASGKREVVGKIADPKEIKAKILPGWNEYRITAVGNHVIQQINRIQRQVIGCRTRR